jgi:hypothetical protein
VGGSWVAGGGDVALCCACWNGWAQAFVCLPSRCQGQPRATKGSKGNHSRSGSVELARAGPKAVWAPKQPGSLAGALARRDRGTPFGGVHARARIISLPARPNSQTTINTAPIRPPTAPDDLSARL